MKNKEDLIDFTKDKYEPPKPDIVIEEKRKNGRKKKRSKKRRKRK